SPHTFSADSVPAGLEPTATSAPAAAIVTAHARPMPRDPPLMKTFLPARLKLGNTYVSDTLNASAMVRPSYRRRNMEARPADRVIACRLERSISRNAADRMVRSATRL